MKGENKIKISSHYSILGNKQMRKIDNQMCIGLNNEVKYDKK